MRSLVRRNRFLDLMAAAVAAGTLSACGGASEPSTQGPTSQAGDGAAAGKQLFGQRCAACHSLTDANSTATIGPNLDEVQPNAQRVEEKVRNGGGGMPAFETQLNDEQIRAVAAYVAQAAGS